MIGRRRIAGQSRDGLSAPRCCLVHRIYEFLGQRCSSPRPDDCVMGTGERIFPTLQRSWSLAADDSLTTCDCCEHRCVGRRSCRAWSHVTIDDRGWRWARFPHAARSAAANSVVRPPPERYVPSILVGHPTKWWGVRGATVVIAEMVGMAAPSESAGRLELRLRYGGQHSTTDGRPTTVASARTADGPAAWEQTEILR